MTKKTNTFKRLFVIVVCCFLAFSLVGCSPISLNTKQYKNGQVSSLIGITIKDMTFTNKQKTYSLIDEYSKQLEKEYKTNTIKLFSNIYDFDKLNCKNDDQKMSYIAPRHPNFIAGSRVLSPKTITDKTENITLQVDFVSIYAYLMYFCPKAIIYNAQDNTISLDSSFYSTLIDVPVPSEKLEKKDEVFVYSYIQKCKPFSYNLEEPYLFSKYKTYEKNAKIVDVACAELGINKDQAQYVYNFISPYSRLHSSADKITQNGGYYVHSWNLGNDINKVITIFRKSANSLWWYVLAIGIGITIICVGVGIFIFKKNKKTQVNKETLRQLDEIIRISAQLEKEEIKEKEPTEISKNIDVNSSKEFEIKDDNTVSIDNKDSRDIEQNPTIIVDQNGDAMVEKQIEIKTNLPKDNDIINLGYESKKSSKIVEKKASNKTPKTSKNVATPSKNNSKTNKTFTTKNHSTKAIVSTPKKITAKQNKTTEKISSNEKKSRTKNKDK